MSVPSASSSQLELWGGLECTVNRVGDTFFDQLERTGHATHLADLDRFAALGLKTLRYPMLWERTAPNSLAAADWSWADERLGRLRELHIQPILGLVHHGSGPRHTSLIDPSFATGLAEYAHAVASRYPWITHYTPVNEPLTTARFSGLYGHWYPHGQDVLTFCRALLTQCKAVVLAMQAIRTINPTAQLVQTEDLGKTFSTPALGYQAEFENVRRWITFDLLCGRVDHEHPMFHYLRWAGIEEADISWFLDHSCPPDILGLNYYPTSERFLDEDVARYPSVPQGGNGQHTYVDVEAVRVRRAGIVGPRGLLLESWERYGRPLVVTEAHLGCTREEQLRWLFEVWQAACELRQTGVDVRAVTAWSLLGAYDWHTLVTRFDGHYEPGVFDLRAPTPRPTALATLIHELATGRIPNHPLLSLPGWWQRPERLIFGFALDAAQDRRPASPVREQARSRRAPAQPLMIIEAATHVGKAIADSCAVRGIPYQLLTQHELDVSDATTLETALNTLRPWAIINTAGCVSLGHPETLPELGPRVQFDDGTVLASACARHGVQLLTFSSELVFDGRQDRPYVESDAVTPLSAIGGAQATAETCVLERLPRALIVRTSAVFGPRDTHNFILKTLAALRQGKVVVAPGDCLISPTFIPDLVHVFLDLLIDGERGCWHLANAGAISWADLARSLASLAGLDACQIDGRPAQVGTALPRYRVLGSERGMLLPSCEDALARYVPTILP